MKSIFCIFVLVFISVVARATGIANFYEIDFVRVDKSGLGFVQFTKKLAETPPMCGKFIVF
jgi:hypothetical protein